MGFSVCCVTELPTLKSQKTWLPDRHLLQLKPSFFSWYYDLLTCPIATRLRQELISLPAQNSSTRGLIRFGQSDTGLVLTVDMGVCGSISTRAMSCWSLTCRMRHWSQSSASHSPTKPGAQDGLHGQLFCQTVLSADRFKVFPIQWPESCSSSFLPNTPQHSPLASMEDCIDVRFLRFSQQQPSYSWTFLMTVGIVAIHGQMWHGNVCHRSISFSSDWPKSS